jgi:glycosyltransferase involved in cell wall biosynthesis
VTVLPEEAVLQEPVVSVIMPVYNQQRYVRLAIKSILQQTGIAFELIIVNDGSTDKSLSIIQSVSDPRVKVISQQNAGYGAALNRGIEVARGRYIARMDSDDLSLPGRLAKEAAFLDTHPDYVMVGTLGSTATPYGKVTRSAIPPDAPAWQEQTWQMVMSGSRDFIDPSVMFRTEIARKIGGYRTYQASGMDVDFWLRLLETGGKAAVLNEYLYSRRITFNSLIEDPITTARNQIPRILAQERIETGSDRIMRGEAIADLITTPMLTEARQWNVGRQWRKVEKCIDAHDWLAALQFAWLGLRRGGIRKRNLMRSLRALAHVRKLLPNSRQQTRQFTAHHS